jgi:DNA repair protein RadA/Sms
MAASIRPLPRIRFVCAECGAAQPKWEGRCAACGAWNSLAEDAGPSRMVRARANGEAQPLLLDALIAAPPRRLATGLAEVDRVLGGGVVPGSVVLLGGDPGIGKSTLALQLAGHCGSAAAPSLYCAGEESAAQVALRARRLNCASATVCVLVETDIDAVIAGIDSERPPLVIVDSVQTAHDASAPGLPGSPSQVRQAVSRLTEVAKATGVPIVVVGHVTKEGAIAGPRTLEHLVDVVLYLEGERLGDHRLLRGVKNRFGSTGEVGLLSMEQTGMRQLTAPSRAFLDNASLGAPGSVLTITCDGLRPLGVEIQALTIKAGFGPPRRTAAGFDVNRLHLLLAVLEKRARVALSQSDVYASVVGGVHVGDPGVDLAIALAVAGSVRAVTVPAGWAVFGEVGLGGEIRQVRRLEARLAEATALGVEHAVVPSAYAGRVPTGLRPHPVATIAAAVTLLS